MLKSINKRLLLYILFLFFLSVFSSSAQNNDSKHFLWQIQSQKATVFLLGSIHLAKEELYPLDPIITDSYDSSDFLVVEVDMNKANPLEIMKRATYQDGQTLKSSLKLEVFNKMKDAFDSLKMPEILYSKMKPWFAVMTLTNLKLMKEGYKADSGIDMFFMNSATNSKKEVLELESADFQINLMDSVLGKFQNEFVLYTLTDLDSSSEAVDGMFEIWEKGDQQALEDNILEQFKLLPNAEVFIKKFLTERNEKMAGKINDFLQTDKTYFVVVGAAHIIGKDGILDLIGKSKKYSIKQL